MKKEEQKEIKLIAIYARVSTSNQEEEKTIKSQFFAINEFIKEKGYTIVQKYVDDGWSEDIIARPGLDSLRQDARKKIWDAVLIYDPDRLGRAGWRQELIIEELNELNIPVLFVTIPPPKNDEDKIMYGMRGLFAQYEKMKITERFRLGKVRKATEGYIIASEAPYGYNFIKRHGKQGDQNFRQGYYKINDYEASIVKNIFAWVADDHLTLRGVVKKLQNLGILPRKSSRAVWSTSTLGTLLRNKTYIGEGHYGASYAVIPVNPIKKDGYRKVKKTSRRYKPEEQWIKISTPVIIDTNLFDRVQIQLKLNFERCKRNKKNEYLLSHKIWCTCGNRRTGEGVAKGKHLYYRCNNRIKNFPLPPTCSEKGLNARLIDALVWQKVSELMSSPELLLKQAERWLNNQHAQKATPTADKLDTKSEIQKLKDQENRYTKAYGTSLISMDQLKEFISPIKEKIKILENQAAKVRQEEESQKNFILPSLVEVTAFAEQAAKSLCSLNFEVKQGIVWNIVDKIVGTTSELQIYGHIPLNSHVGYKTINRHRRSPKRW